MDRFSLGAYACEEVRQPLEARDSADELRADTIHYLSQLLQSWGKVHLEVTHTHTYN